MDRRRAALRGGAGGRPTWPLRRLLLVGAPTLFVSLFLLYPLAALIDLGLRPSGRPELGVLGRVATDPGLRGVVTFTLWQAVASTILTLGIGLPVAYVVSRYRFRGRGALRALSIAPFALPTVVVGTAFLALLGDGGPVVRALDAIGLAATGLDRSVAAILVAHAFFNVSVVVLVVGAALAHVDPALEESAAVLGAGRFRAVLRVALPAVRSSVLVAASVVFLFSFTSFGVILLLAPAGRSTIEVEIWRQTTQLLDLPVAAALSVVQLVAVGALLLVTGRIESKAPRRRLVPAERTARPPRTRGERAVVVGVAGGAFLLVGAPIAALAARAVSSPTGFTLSRFSGFGQERSGGILAVSPLEATGNSLAFAAAATMLALALGAAAAAALSAGRGGGPVRALLTLPLGASAVTVGLGAIIAFDRPPLDLRGTTALVVVAQAVVALPFVVRILTPALREMDAGPREAAAVLGATPGRVRRSIVIPMVWRSGLVAASLAFAVALGEFGATTFVARADRPTIPIAIVRLLDRPGADAVGRAAAMALLLAAVTAGAMVAIERLRPGAGLR